MLDRWDEAKDSAGDVGDGTSDDAHEVVETREVRRRGRGSAATAATAWVVVGMVICGWIGLLSFLY